MATKNRGFRSLVGGVLGDLDYFPVAGISDDDAAFGIVGGLHRSYFYDASLAIVANNSPYQIIPDDNATGTGAWVLSGYQGANSHIDVSSSAGTLGMGDTAWTPVVFENSSSVRDPLSEYSIITGLATVTYSKSYDVSASIWLASAVWGSGKVIGLAIVLNGTRVKLGPRYQLPSGTFIAGADVSGTIKATAGQTIGVELFHTQGGSINLGNSDAQCWLTIDGRV